LHQVSDVQVLPRCNVYVFSASTHALQM